jgi:alkylation response protein AidB-like acyl-CoA dehydrogenase
VLPRIGSVGAPGERSEGGLSVHGVASRRILTTEHVVVVVADTDEHVAVVLQPGALELRPVRGIDPSYELVEVNADGVTASAGTAVPWPVTVATGQVALAHQLIGAAVAMLRLSRDHAVTREQFGSTLSSFQAVRHRLADSLVAIESARAAAAGAEEFPSPVAAVLAKAIAGRSARAVAAHAQQVLGGMGFTAEHPFQGYLRRTMLLDQLLGSRDHLTRELGHDIIRTRALPATLPL